MAIIQHFQKNFFEFYRLFEKYLTKLDFLSQKILTQILQHSLDIQKHFKSKIDSCILKLSEIMTSIINQKKNEVIKHNYFNLSKVVRKIFN